MRYERVLKRIQRSGPSNTAYCVTDGGTTQAHTVSKHVGSLSRKNWTLRRMLVDVRKEADSSNPPQEPGLQGRSHATEAAPTKSIRSNTSRRMKVRVEPVSRSATHR